MRGRLNLFFEYLIYRFSVTLDTRTTCDDNKLARAEMPKSHFEEASVWELLSVNSFSVHMAKRDTIHVQSESIYGSRTNNKIEQQNMFQGTS